MILPAITVGLGIVLIASGVLHILRERSHRNVKRQRDRLDTENESLHKDLLGIRATIKARDIEMDCLHGEKIALLAQNADLREALQEAQAELKSLHMNTIEVPEVTPAPLSYAQTKEAIEKAAEKRAPQRRNMSKKAETKP